MITAKLYRKQIRETERVSALFGYNVEQDDNNLIDYLKSIAGPKPLVFNHQANEYTMTVNGTAYSGILRLFEILSPKSFQYSFYMYFVGKSQSGQTYRLNWTPVSFDPYGGGMYSENISRDGIILSGPSSSPWAMCKPSIVSNNLTLSYTTPLSNYGNINYVISHRNLTPDAIEMTYPIINNRVAYYDDDGKNYFYVLFNVFDTYRNDVAVNGISMHSYFYIGDKQNGSQIDRHYVHSSHYTCFDQNELDIGKYINGKDYINYSLFGNGKNKLYLFFRSYSNRSYSILECELEYGKIATYPIFPYYEKTLATVHYSDLETRYINRSYDSETKVNDLIYKRIPIGGKIRSFIFSYEYKDNDFIIDVNGKTRKIPSRFCIYEISDAGIYQQDNPYLWTDYLFGSTGFDIFAPYYPSRAALVDDYCYFLGVGNIYRVQKDLLDDGRNFVKNISIDNITINREYDGVDSISFDTNETDLQLEDMLEVYENDVLLGKFVIKQFTELRNIESYARNVTGLSLAFNQLAKASDKYVEFESIKVERAKGKDITNILNVQAPILEKTDTYVLAKAKVSEGGNHWRLSTVSSGKSMILKMNASIESTTIVNLIAERMKYINNKVATVAMGARLFSSEETTGTIFDFGQYSGWYDDRTKAFSSRGDSINYPKKFLLERGQRNILIRQKEDHWYLYTRPVYNDSETLIWVLRVSTWIDPVLTMQNLYSGPLTTDNRLPIGMIGMSYDRFIKICSTPIDWYYPCLSARLSYNPLIIKSNNVYVTRWCPPVDDFPIPITVEAYNNYYLQNEDIYIKHNFLDGFYKFKAKNGRKDASSPLFTVSTVSAGSNRILFGNKYILANINPYGVYDLRLGYYETLDSSTHPSGDLCTKISGYNNYINANDFALFITPMSRYHLNKSYYISDQVGQNGYPSTPLYPPESGMRYYESFPVRLPTLPDPIDTSKGISYQSVSYYPTLWLSDQNGSYDWNFRLKDQNGQYTNMLYLPWGADVYINVGSREETSITITEATVISGNSVCGLTEFIKEIANLSNAKVDLSKFVSEAKDFYTEAFEPYELLKIRGNSALLEYTFDDDQIDQFAYGGTGTVLDAAVSNGVIHYVDGDGKRYGYIVMPRRITAAYYDESSDLVTSNLSYWLCFYYYEADNDQRSITRLDMIQLDDNLGDVPHVRYYVMDDCISVFLGKEYFFTFEHEKLEESENSVVYVAPISAYTRQPARTTARMHDLGRIIEYGWIDVGEPYMSKILNMSQGIDMHFRSIGDVLDFFRESDAEELNITVDPFTYSIYSSMPMLSGRILVDGIIYAEFIDPDIARVYGNNYSRITNTGSDTVADLVKEVSRMRKNANANMRSISFSTLAKPELSLVLPGTIIRVNTSEGIKKVRIKGIMQRILLGGNIVTMKGDIIE